MHSKSPQADKARGSKHLPALEPFLHHEADHIYNPLTDLVLRDTEADYMVVQGLASGDIRLPELDAGLQEELTEQGWLVADTEDFGRRFFLKYVTLEATTSCNQSCYFCPVSLHPRVAYAMPMEEYERIVSEISAYRSTIEAVFTINYNEPTIDRYFIERLQVLKQHGLPPAVNTNGSGLTNNKIDAIMAFGGLRYLSVNLSTLNQAKYVQDRGHDHLPVVLENLNYAKTRRVAQQMDIAVLGCGDDEHRGTHRRIAELFKDSFFKVKYFEIMDRAGYLPVGLKPQSPHARLRGCKNLGSRPLQHLHITPYGKCILCCEDYSEEYVIGDLAQQSINEILTGPAAARLRGWSYGLEQAPDDFLCRRCIFARTEKA